MEANNTGINMISAFIIENVKKKKKSYTIYPR